MNKFERMADFLMLYKGELEKKQAWGKVESWRYSQFVSLSEKLHDVTGIMVSHTTLIRIFQKLEFKRSPQKATLNALAKYIGYTSWNNFCYENIDRLPYKPEKENTPPQNAESRESAKQASPIIKHSQSRKAQYIQWGIATITTLLIAMVGWHLAGSMKTAEEVYFDCKKTTGTYPYRFTFLYKIPSEGYSIHFRSQSFSPYMPDTLEPKKALHLDPKDTITYSQTLMPDHYWAELVKDGKTVKRIPIKVRTDGWIGIVAPYAKMRGKRIKYEAVPCNTQKNEEGFLALPQQLRQKIQSEMLDKGYEVNFFKVDESGIDTNELRFTAKFKVSHVETKKDCRYIRTTLLTNRGIIEVPLSDEGCPNHNKVWFGDFHASYRKQDLSKYQIPNLGYETLKIQTHDGKGEVYLNGKLLESVDYETPLGELIGLRFKFEGWAEIDGIEISTQQGKIVYQSDFSSNQQPDKDSTITMK